MALYQNSSWPHWYLAMIRLNFRPKLKPSKEFFSQIYFSWALIKIQSLNESIIEFIYRYTSDQCSGHGICVCDTEDARNVLVNRIILAMFVNLRILMVILLTMIMMELPMQMTTMTTTMELMISLNLNMLGLTRVLVNCWTGKTYVIKGELLFAREF